MEKVRGKVFAACFRNLGEDQFINCSINLELANMKMFNLHRKLTHFSVP